MQPRRINRYRFVFRWHVRVRKEGGSLSMTIPRYIVRKMNINPGDKLSIRLNEEGIVMRPHYFRGVDPEVNL